MFLVKTFVHVLSVVYKNDRYYLFLVINSIYDPIGADP